MTWKLRAFALRIESEIAIPGAQPDAAGDGPDLKITLGKIPDDPVLAELGPYRLSQDAVLFTMPGVARYRCARDGRHLLIAVEGGVPEETVSAYVVATALPVLLWMRGKIMLHAAGVVLDAGGGAMALAGPSGIGKSSLLRTLLAEGAEAVGDDCLALSVDGETVRIAGLPASTQMLSTGRDARCFVPVAPDRQRISAPLLHLVELCPDGPADPQRLSPIDAFALLLRNLHRPRVPRLLGMNAELLPRLTMLAASVPAWKWGAQAARECSPEDLAEVLRNLAEGGDQRG